MLEYLEDNRIELYRLSDDIGESRNVAKQQPDVASRLRKALDQWRRQIDAPMPTLNPDRIKKKRKDT